MASRPPPRYVVRPHDATTQRRRMLWLGLAWFGSLLLVGALVAAALGVWSGAAPVIADKRQLRALTAQNDDLKQQVANLQRSQEVTNFATKSLRETISQRDEEISGLRADLGFYSRLVGGDAQREGLKVQQISVQPVANSHAWDVTISLTQNIKRDQDTSGVATIKLEGLRAGKVVQLDWPTLGDAAEKDGIPFQFKYFQQLHATIMLPPDFQPTRLDVSAQPQGSDTISRAMAWSDALSDHTSSQGD